MDSRDEVYAVFEVVYTRVVKFGPAVGQLQKSGTDPLPVLKDFRALLRNIHLKDYLGERYWARYYPLGKDKVDLPAVMDALEKADGLQYVMVELDGAVVRPWSPFSAPRPARNIW